MKRLNNSVSYNVYMAYLEKNQPTLDTYARSVLDGLLLDDTDETATVSLILVESLVNAMRAYQVHTIVPGCERWKVKCLKK